MNQITDVTIISNNLNKNIFSEYDDYLIIDNNFSYGELLEKKRVIFYNVLNNLNKEELDKLFTYLKDNKILFINATNDIELCLYTKFLKVYDNNTLVLDGLTLAVLKNEKILKRLGVHLPFIVDLSILLKDYGMIDELCINKERIVDLLWK